MQTQLLTFITDYGYADGSLALLKSHLLQAVPGIQLIDINNQVKPFHISQAAYLAENLYHRFPKHSIHFIATTIFQQKNNPLLVAQCDDHFFIGVDNGIFSLLFEDRSVQYKVLSDGIPKNMNQLIADTVQTIVEKNEISSIGLNSKGVKAVIKKVPFIKENHLEGEIIFTDNFGNAITNVKRELFEKNFTYNRSQINFGSSHRINKIDASMAETDEGELFAVFNEFNYLLLGMKNYDFARLFDLKDGNKISIDSFG